MFSGQCFLRNSMPAKTSLPGASVVKPTKDSVGASSKRSVALMNISNSFLPPSGTA